MLGTQKKTKRSEPHGYSWESRRRKRGHPRDIAGKAEEKEEVTQEILFGTQKKNGSPQRYSWEHRKEEEVNGSASRACR